MPHNNNNNRAIGIRKSQFNAKTTAEASDTFDYVTPSGDNIKIKFSDLLASLGFSGTIEQVGNVLDAPVLDIQGQTNGIRNIAGGFGINTSINPSNSLEIATDFTFDTTGAALVDNPLASNPAFISLIAGTGITLEEAIGTITLSVITPAEQITFNSPDDMEPFLSGGEYLLPDNRSYLQGAGFTISNSIVPGDNSEWTSISSFHNPLIFTGPGIMFKAANRSFKISNTRAQCDNAEFINGEHSSPGLHSTNVTNVNLVNCKSIGTFNQARAIVFNGFSFSDAGTGYTINGINNLLLVFQDISGVTTSPTFKSFDLGTSVAQFPSIRNYQVLSAAPGAVGIDGLADSGNVAVGSKFFVQNSQFLGAITPLVNIDPSDVRWEFDNNTPISNTVNAADMYLSKGTAIEQITINTVGVFEEIGTPSAAGVSWVFDVDSRYEISSAGVMTYIGVENVCPEVISRATVSKQGGGADELEVRLAKNWIFDATPGVGGIEKTRATTQNSAPTTIPVGGLIELSNGDTLRLIYANNGTTSNINTPVSEIRVKS